ncbi:microtubule-associated protein Jupiter-like isoform X2 [Tachypleus tridentatus]|uniref:microtubule-associated protein Jupiter-like isoform X2 n=1 Tax=Tachypleus tridentatus TaxID=6853 RepID=UPI003FD59844
MTSTGFSVGFCNQDRSSSKVTKPPGGPSSDIFGSVNGHDEQKSRPLKNRMQSNIFGAGDASGNCFTPQRRSFDAANTQDKLFGSDVTDTTPKKVVNRMKSNIFTGPEPVIKPYSAKKYGPVRRNPITGEVYDDVSKMNGHTNGHLNGRKLSNSTINNGDPGSPSDHFIRTRIPPGGKSSGIF